MLVGGMAKESGIPFWSASRVTSTAISIQKTQKPQKENAPGRIVCFMFPFRFASSTNGQNVFQENIKRKPAKMFSSSFPPTKKQKLTGGKGNGAGKGTGKGRGKGAGKGGKDRGRKNKSKGMVAASTESGDDDDSQCKQPGDLPE